MLVKGNRYIVFCNRLVVNELLIKPQLITDYRYFA